jgi:hypothetical protein
VFRLRYDLISMPPRTEMHRRSRRVLKWRVATPRSTVWDYLDLWEWDGTIERIHHTLYIQSREQAGRDASPTTAIIDA